MPLLNLGFPCTPVPLRECHKVEVPKSWSKAKAQGCRSAYNQGCRTTIVWIIKFSIDQWMNVWANISSFSNIDRKDSSWALVLRCCMYSPTLFGLTGLVAKNYQPAIWFHSAAVLQIKDTCVLVRSRPSLGGSWQLLNCQRSRVFWGLCVCYAWKRLYSRNVEIA